ncbi:ArsR/SmtB family transcription factor [Streptomyces venezuelae]|uniref:ArsR/SmtB family transcription factor n=1 Tax=Streptomyces venezuelae TaxID=54571 RepID=UPI00278BD750|nr:winged helix-turn-helix domain-containing protein [Streptomyces venezuelae]
MTGEELLVVLSAVGHPQRLRIVAELSRGRRYVSELARCLVISRPLLYMHLERLEKAGIVVGTLELSEDGKALRYFELVPFDVRLNVAGVLAAVQGDSAPRGEYALASERGQRGVSG